MSLFKTIAELEESQTPFAIVTIINATESSPGRTAFKMVVTQTASWGSVGGGTLEYQAQKLAREAMIRRIPTQTLSVDLTDEALGGNGMACGGHADLLIETFQPAPKLFIFGGGHIGTALTNIMSRCGFEENTIIFQHRTCHIQLGHIQNHQYIPFPGRDHRAVYFISETDFA